MIWDSAPWKNEIVRVVRALYRRKSQKRWNEASFAKLEKEIFYSAFAVRKLLEAKKLSDEIEDQSVEAIGFPPTARPADIINWHRLDELYDLTRPSPCQISLKEFCNQFIHSFVFQAVLLEEERGLAGLHVSSDHKKAENLYYFDIDQIIDLLYAVASDDIVTLKMHRKGVGQPMEVLVKSSKMDDEAFHSFDHKVLLKGGYMQGNNAMSQDKPKKQTQHTARTGLSQRQKMQMEFWADFRDYLISHSSTVKAIAPQPQSFNNLSGWSDIHLVAVASSVNRLHNASEPGEIRAELAMHGDNGDIYFQALQTQKAAIEQECGENLNWYNKTPRKRRIFVRKDVDLDDRSRWPEYFTWLQRKLEKLHQAFAPRVKAIKELQVKGEA